MLQSIESMKYHVSPLGVLDFVAFFVPTWSPRVQRQVPALEERCDVLEGHHEMDKKTTPFFPIL